MAVQLSVLGLYLPPVFKWRSLPSYVRPRRSFRCRSRLPCERLGAVGALVVLVAVQLFVLGLYLPPVFKAVVAIISTPDDHFSAGPDCRVTISGSGRVGGAGGCPTIRAGIVSPAGVQVLPSSAPDDHFAAGPDCRVSSSGKRGISGGRSRPRIICARRFTRVGNFGKSVDNLP